MILAKARVVEKLNGHLKVRLSFPTGFDPDEVVTESVRANDRVLPETVRVDPRRGKLDDIFRECEVWFRSDEVAPPAGDARTLRITGSFKRGIPFVASVSLDDKTSTH